MSNVKQFVLRRLNKIAVALFYVGMLVFLFFYIKGIDFSPLESLQFAWHLIIIAALFGLAMRFWQIIGWLVILKDLGATTLKDSYVQLAYVYAKSWLGRYIPGTAPWILGKIYFASQHGISKTRLAVSSLLEAILQVSVVLTFSLALLLLDSRFNTIGANLRLGMVAALAICLIVIVPPVFNRLAAFAYKLIRKKDLPADHKMPIKTLFKGAALYIAGGALYGIFLFFLAKGAYEPLAYSDMLFVMGAGNLAGALGILAIFTPSGLGVRDAAMLLLLGLIMPPEFALAITVLTRLCDVALDLIFFALSWLLLKLRENHST